MKPLVTASSFTRLPEGTVPDEIVYMPEGEHTITPMVDGKPKQITVKVPAAQGIAIAATLQADLDRRLATNVRPIIDFDHKHSGPASAIPKAFRYEAGKGIILAVDWTNAGKAAVEGRDFSYFSPEFLLNKDGTPGGLPERGPLGTLCNNPAFREIPRIAASDAEPTHQTTDTMDKFLILATCGLLSTNEAARENADELARQRVAAMRGDSEKLTTATTDLETLRKENADLKVKVEASEKLVKEAAEKRANDLVTVAATDGRIAPKDEKTKEFYKRLIAAGDADAEEALKSLTKRADLATPIIVRANDQKPGPTGEHALETKARELVTAKQAPDFDSALEQVAASEPALYQDYLKTNLVG